MLIRLKTTLYVTGSVIKSFLTLAFFSLSHSPDPNENFVQTKKSVNVAEVKY